jgi:hypothetical protein
MRPLQCTLTIFGHSHKFGRSKLCFSEMDDSARFDKQDRICIEHSRFPLVVNFKRFVGRVHQCIKPPVREKTIIIIMKP